MGPASLRFLSNEKNLNLFSWDLSHIHTSGASQINIGQLQYINRQTKSIDFLPLVICHGFKAIRAAQKSPLENNVSWSIVRIRIYVMYWDFVMYWDICHLSYAGVILWPKNGIKLI